eukprot:TRINITY_DN8331_c0_g1_i1.p1 TRINITY_DN8331_c0_g1~~TRINITY_DN8331_c0_g1_i1.p1  ORF type:complete len:379 (+),score=95.26 TRINITY_DN8331_c0_g1_i1:66-1202(+)
MGIFSGLTRNTVNQGVAFVVFLVLLHYAWSKDMLFKPDPAIPHRGGKPRRDRATDMYIFPTLPAFYASADNIDQLQPLFEADHDAMAFTRSLAQVYMKYYSPEKPEFSLALDIGSPWSTWGLFLASLGMKTSILQPRSNQYRRVDAALAFGKLGKMGRLSRKGLSNQRVAVGYDNKNNRWVPIINNRVSKEDDIDAATTVLYQDEMGHGAAFLAHLGSDARILPALRGIVDAADMPKMVMVDVAGRMNAVIDYTTKNEDTFQKEFLSISDTFRKAGYSVKLFPEKACPVDTSAYSNTTLLNYHLFTVPHSQQEDLLKQLYTIATTPNPAPLCRLIWIKQEDFEKTTPPFVFLTLVTLKLICVLFICYKKKKKAVSRSL